MSIKLNNQTIKIIENNRNHLLKNWKAWEEVMIMNELMLPVWLLIGDLLIGKLLLELKIIEAVKITLRNNGKIPNIQIITIEKYLCQLAWPVKCMIISRNNHNSSQVQELSALNNKGGLSIGITLSIKVIIRFQWYSQSPNLRTRHRTAYCSRIIGIQGRIKWSVK